MSYTKPVITDPYYEKPEWISHEVTRREFICLSGESTEQDVELFLILLFGYNDININQSFRSSFIELLEEEEVALSGGIAFFEDDNKYILPSCCCGLEDISYVKDTIINKGSPWMGHDPTPGITYIHDQVYVWPDDSETINSDVNKAIRYQFKQLLDFLERTQKEMQDFIEGPLYNWVAIQDKEIAVALKEQMKQWIIK